MFKIIQNIKELELGPYKKKIKLVPFNITRLHSNPVLSLQGHHKKNFFMWCLKSDQM